jgi:myo-inositol-1(or 4)-monophosphatase
VLEITEKTGAGDLVTQIDEEAERAIVDLITSARPDDGILGEEGTDREGSTGVRWVIDPVDGTASYVRGYPGYCVSIGVEVDGDPTVGVVVDARGIRTEAIVGVGAWRGEQPILPSERTDLAHCVFATGFGYDPEERERQAHVLAYVLPRIADIRRGGSAAFDLVASACGEVDGYYEIGLNPWDLCAGQAIVRAAGGICESIPQGDGRTLVVSTPAQLFEPLRALLAEAGYVV